MVVEDAVYVCHLGVVMIYYFLLIASDVFITIFANQNGVKRKVNDGMDYRNLVIAFIGITRAGKTII